MLFLFETAAGYALFKVVKESKLEKTEVSSGSRALLAAPTAAGHR